MSELNIKVLLAQKSALEKGCERKKWVWQKTLRQHIKLEKVDVKLQELDYDFDSN